MMWVVAGAVSRERTHRDAGNCNELFNSVDKNKRTLSGVSFSHWMVREVLVSSTLLCITDLLHTSRFACFQRKRTEGFAGLEGPTAAILSGTVSWVPRQHLPPPHFWPLGLSPGLPTLGTIPHRDHPAWDPSNSNRQQQPAGWQARPWNVENEPLPWGDSLSPLMEVAGSEREKRSLSADSRKC